MKSKLYYLIGIASVTIGMRTFPKCDLEQPFPDSERVAILSFFEDFKEAINAKDAERIKVLSGKTWKHWSRAINDGGVLESIEVLSINADSRTNVVTKCTVVDDGSSTNSMEVIFAMEKSKGVYSIAGMAVPEIDKSNLDFDAAHNVIRQLICAINRRNIDQVKELVSFGDAADFEDELSVRGLAWIKAAIQSGITCPGIGSGVSRVEKDLLVGRIYVPCGLGGTNVLRKVVFKGSKIDRAVMKEGTAAK